MSALTIGKGSRLRHLGFRHLGLRHLGFRCLGLAGALVSLSGCSLIWAYPKGDSHETAATCKNGEDDDYDGRVDCDDPDCAEACRVPPPSPESGADLCRNDIDDDADDAADCDDPGCAEVCVENDAARCSNGLDDDQDGSTDCDDDDCIGYCPEVDLDDCQDGADNDGDGATDAADLGCWAVLPEAPQVTACTSIPSMDVVEPFERLESDRAPSGTYTLRGFRPATLAGRTDRFDAVLAVDMGEFEIASRFRLPPQPTALVDALFDVLSGAALRLLLVPVGIADLEGLSMDEANAGVEVTTDGATARVTLRTFGASETLEVPPGPWRARLAVAADSVAVTLTPLVEGAAAELTVPLTTALGPTAVIAQLTASPDSETGTYIDDLRVRVWERHPCGSEAPALRSSDPGICSEDWPVASSDVGGLLAVASWEEAGAAPGTDDPPPCGVFLEADRSDDSASVFSAQLERDGYAWTSRGTVTTLDPGVTTNGVGVTRFGDGWFAVAGVGEGSAAELRFFTSADCDIWQAETSVAAPGAFSPSLVDDRTGNVVLYYWRQGAAGTFDLVQSSDGRHADDRDAVFGSVPAEFGLRFPVAITRWFDDLALIYGIDAPGTAAGLALATWAVTPDSVKPSPATSSSALRSLTRPLLLPDRDADEVWMPAGSLVWNGSQPLAVYSATGRVRAYSWPVSAQMGTVVRTSALALVESLDVVNTGTCGDELCDAPGEDCDTCAMDCCSWLPVDPTPFSYSSSFWSSGLARGVFSYADPLVWELPEALTGDFALDIPLEVRQRGQAGDYAFALHLRDAEGRGPRLVGLHRSECALDAWAFGLDVDGREAVRLREAPCEDLEHWLPFFAPIRILVARQGSAYTVTVVGADECALAPLEATLPTGEPPVQPSALEVTASDQSPMLVIQQPRLL